MGKESLLTVRDDPSFTMAPHPHDPTLLEVHFVNERGRATYVVPRGGFVDEVVQTPIQELDRGSEG
jgi:hypothetical protein